LIGLLHSPYAEGLFDLWFLFVPWWAGDHAQLPNTGRVMVFLTEADLVLSAMSGLNTQVLRGNSPTYRSYEVAGAPHVDNSPASLAYGFWNEELLASTPFDWSPVSRALFWAGHRWATEGAEPPPSAMLAQAPAGAPDPVYEEEFDVELETGIARDANGNALGGIRLPDVEVGRGRFIAVDPDSFFGGLFGDFRDLECQPLAGGDARFRNHGDYVSQFTKQAESLVEQGLLLAEDAESMISDAAGSEVGKPGVCTPSELPISGEGGDPGHVGTLAWSGLALVGAVLGFGLLLARQRSQLAAILSRR
jgi:hypothetical protein